MVVWEQWSSSINLKRKISGGRNLKSILFHWGATTTFSVSHNLISSTKYTRYIIQRGQFDQATLDHFVIPPLVILFTLLSITFLCCNFVISVHEISATIPKQIKWVRVCLCYKVTQSSAEWRLIYSSQQVFAWTISQRSTYVTIGYYLLSELF